MKKCNRIYHEFLRTIDSGLYQHLMRNQVTPELQLMRWLRCVLSREFTIEHTLVLWDYIFGGIESKHRSERRCRGLEFLETHEDPLINIDYLCTSMIVTIKEDLLESDFSMCMANLLNYPKPANGLEPILKQASEIKQQLKEPPPPIKNPDDFFENLKRQ